MQRELGNQKCSRKKRDKPVFINWKLFVDVAYLKVKLKTHFKPPLELFWLKKKVCFDIILGYPYPYSISSSWWWVANEYSKLPLILLMIQNSRFLYFFFFITWNKRGKNSAEDNEEMIIICLERANMWDDPFIM